MATRLPCGSGWCNKTLAVCIIWVSVSTRMIPVWPSNASTVASGGQLSGSAQGCGSPAVPRVAASDGTARIPMPTRTATIGLRWDTRRAIRANWRGLPNDST